jgi:uncharacterized membrane protein YecN with MAPEG domain
MNDSFAALALYAGLNAILLVVLAINAGARRGRQKAFDPGATGDAALTRAIRAHGNFAETAPLVLIVLAALALTNIATLPIHVLGTTFTLARISHAFGMMLPKHPNVLRLIGNVFTWLVLLGGGLLCLARFFETLSA